MVYVADVIQAHYFSFHKWMSVVHMCIVYVHECVQV